MAGAEGGPGRAEGRGCQSAEVEAITSSREVTIWGEGMGNLGAVTLCFLKHSSAESAFPRTLFWLFWDRDDRSENALKPWLEPVLRSLNRIH